MAEKMTEHQALGEALAMLRDLMIAVVRHESLPAAQNVLAVHMGNPAKWNRCWRDAEEAMKEPKR